MLDVQALDRELARLRRGPAARHPALPKRLGPWTRQVCGIGEDDPAPAARHKLATAIEMLMRDQPREVVLALHAALALHRDAGAASLSARQRWLAGQLGCGERTARRRIGDAFARLVRQAAGRGAGAVPPAEGHGWRVHAVRARLRLDTATADLTEQRTLLFTRDGIGAVLIRPDQPAPRYRRGEGVTVVEVTHGGRLTGTATTPDGPGYVVELPRDFRAGQGHELAVRVTLAPGQPAEPQYLLVPPLGCRSLELLVRFDPARPPVRAWRLDAVAPAAVRAVDPAGAPVAPDRFGDLRLRYHRLRPGLGYGLRWEPRGAAHPGPGWVPGPRVG